MFARYLDLRTDIDKKESQAFDLLIQSINKIAERRNELVHSHYHSLITEDKRVGLLRQNSKLKSSKGTRQQIEEILHTEDFTSDLIQLDITAHKLEELRRNLIDWQYWEPAGNNA